MTSLYNEDLSYVHHVGFSDFATQVGDEIIRILSEASITSGLVIDLGCGSGIWARTLVRKGFDVLGFDVSESMIHLARQTAPEAEFYCSSIYDIALRPCAAVTAIGEGLNYCVGDIPAEAVLEDLFHKVADSLGMGGIFAFDIIVQSDGPPLQYRSWSKGTDWAVLIEVDEKPDQNRLIRDITTFRKLHDGYRRSEERHEVRVLSHERVENLLSRAGFQVSVASGYGGYTLAPRRMAFVARKATKSQDDLSFTR